MKHLFYLSLVFIFHSCSENIENENMESNNPQPMSYDTTGLEITSEPMPEDQYWESIDHAIVNTKGEREFLDHLTQNLENLSPKEIVGFRLRTDVLLTKSYNSELWCAAYIMNGGCSDDGFEYFRCWLISSGQEIFEAAMKNPDSISNYITEEKEYYELEEFWYVANNAFNNRTGKELYDYIDYDKFHQGEGHYVGNEFTWSEDDPESMKAICPRLYARFVE
jgi:hypothetical protein